MTEKQLNVKTLYMVKLFPHARLYSAVLKIPL